MSKRVNNRKGRRRIVDRAPRDKAESPVILKFWKAMDRIVEESRKNVRQRARERQRRGKPGIFA